MYSKESLAKLQREEEEAFGFFTRDIDREKLIEFMRNEKDRQTQERILRETQHRAELDRLLEMSERPLYVACPDDTEPLMMMAMRPFVQCTVARLVAWDFGESYPPPRTILVWENAHLSQETRDQLRECFPNAQVIFR